MYQRPKAHSVELVLRVRYMFQMPQRRWTYEVPPDLRRHLEAVPGQRSFGAAEVWGEIRDWLVAHHVPVPEDLRLDPEKDESPPRFLTTPSQE